MFNLLFHLGLRPTEFVSIVIALVFTLYFPFSAACMEVNVNCSSLPPVDVFLYSRYDTVAVRKVQECLRRNGCYSGPINGLKNPLTIAALTRNYGRSHPQKLDLAIIPVVPNADCEHLPTTDEFIKSKYDKQTIKKIQSCLKEKGLYLSPIDGITGPLTIKAFEKLDKIRNK